MDRNRRFAELAGILWHERVHQELSKQISNTWRCSCGRNFGCPHGLRVHIGQSNKTNPDFISDPTKALEVMRKRGDWPEFARQISCIPYKIATHVDIIDLHDCDWAIPIGYILDRTGLLVDKAIEFLEGSGK